MKILLLDVNYKKGSTGKIVFDLKSELEKRGEEVIACYGRGGKVSEKNVIKFGYDIETYIHAFLSRITGLMGYFSFFSTKKLLKIIDQFNPDLIHIHETHSYFLNHIRLIEEIKKRKIKTVWTFHCEYMYTGNCGHSYECEKWKINCGRCPDIKRYPKSLFFDFTKKMFFDKKRALENFQDLTIVTPSKWLADRVKKSFLKNKNIEVIHNGINTEIFKPREYNHLKDKHNLKNEKIILGVAPDIMSERKGGQWILKLADELKNENYKFILIGVEDLNQKFPKNVIALARTENQIELAEYYSMADLFIICSFRETFSMTCAESISCGTPILGFKSGAPETIFGEENFAASGDIKSLKQKVLQLLKNEKNLKTINLSKEKMCGEYIKLYGGKK